LVDIVQDFLEGIRILVLIFVGNFCV